jgi:signal transduction histidine kinase
VVTPLRDEAGSLQGFAKVLRDDTQRKHAEEERTILLEREQAARVEAENANNAKDQFLAVLSHELRTPLTPVMALAHILETEEGMPEDLRPIVTIISKNIELEARLIDDLLDLTRISRNKLQLHLQTVDAHQVIHDVIETCRGEIQEKNLQVRVNLEATDYHVKADPARMQQIFWNLLKNAAKFTPAGGEVTIHSANNTEGMLEIGVSDTGIGIEEGLLARIFDSFDQGNYEIARKFGGLGLGLSISRSLVERQGGTLTAASDGTGSGASFLVELETVPAENPESRI